MHVSYKLIVKLIIQPLNQPRIMDVQANKRPASRRSFTFFVFATLATVVPAQTDNESLVDSSPSPWPYYQQVYPGTDPSGETSVGIKSLYFALMMSFGGDFQSSGAIPGVQVALDQINSDPTLLPGYQLHYTLTDSQVCAMCVANLSGGLPKLCKTVCIQISFGDPYACSLDSEGVQVVSSPDPTMYRIEPSHESFNTPWEA